jgi:hypothetical protein
MKIEIGFFNQTQKLADFEFSTTKRNQLSMENR